MTARLLVVAGVMVVASVLIGRASKSEVVPLRASLDTFPLDVGGWRGYRAPDFDADILRVLAVDDYLNRTYVSSSAGSVGLYVGYYSTQREGDTMHSPLNCLPGAGWQAVRRERVSLSVSPSQVIQVNQFLIQKGLDQQVVLYWYQSHGRVVASEYWGKAFLALDALRLNRTDGAMVRIIAPVDDRHENGEAPAQRSAQEFARAIFPILSPYLPL